MLLGGCVTKALEGAPSAMARHLTATLCLVSCFLVLPGLVHKPVVLSRAVTPQVGFNNALMPLMVSLLLTLAQKVPNPADLRRVCKDAAGHMIKERFKSARLCKLLSSSCLSYFFPLTSFSSLGCLLSPGVPVVQKKEGKNVFTK